MRLVTTDLPDHDAPDRPFTQSTNRSGNAVRAETDRSVCTSDRFSPNARLLIIAFAHLVVALASPASADAFPCAPRFDVSTTVPPNTPATLTFRSLRWQFPVGYLNPLPIETSKNPDAIRPDRPTWVVVSDVVEIVVPDSAEAGIPYFMAAWLPTGDYVPIPLESLPDLRPCPGDGGFVVRFRIDWPFLPNSEEAEATRLLRNAAAYRRQTGAARFQGMDWAEHNLDGPITGTQDFWIEDDDGDKAAQLSCTAYSGDLAPPIPICTGEIWVRSRDLVLHVRIPADEHGAWAEITDVLLDLMDGWRNEAEANAGK